MNSAREVDRYIAEAPAESRSKLRQIRATIRRAAPHAIEGVSYGMPHYSFAGTSGFQSRLCYFGLLKSKKKVAFYTRPMFLTSHRDEAEPYLTTKSALQFRLDQPIPLRLIQRVVQSAVRIHKVDTE